MGTVVGRVNSIYSQSVVLELWTPGLVEVVQIQVGFFDSYYPSLATCVFFLRSNLTAQAFGRSKRDATTASDASQRVLSRHATVRRLRTLYMYREQRKQVINLRTSHISIILMMFRFLQIQPPPRRLFLILPTAINRFLQFPLLPSSCSCCLDTNHR